MKWGWRRESETVWRFNAKWSVARDWSTSKWVVVKGEEWLPGQHPDAQAAIEEAEWRMEKQS